MKIIQNIKYQIYLLQLENYEISRFWKISRLNQFKSEKLYRKELVWTSKMKAVVILAVFYFLCDVVVAGILFGWILSFGPIVGIIASIVALIILVNYSNVYLILSVWTLLPLDKYLKTQIINKARKKIAQFPDLKVIGIAGSFGKTTTKEFITQVLSSKYRILATPENINTPLGISQMILDKLDGSVEVLVVEFGEYVKGDVSELASIARPNISVVTGINEAHLERMGSLENSVEAIFEIAQSMHKNGIIFCNADSKLVLDNYKKYTTDIDDVKLYSSVTFGEKIDNLVFEVKNLEFKNDGTGQEFDLISESENLHVTSKLLGGYVAGTSAVAVLVGKDLGLTNEEIARQLKSIDPLPHRLQPIFNTASNILVIDDSYNGNPDGAQEAINVLSKFGNRRKIYVTPGLVEMGEKTEEVHRNLGKELADVADLVVLIKNSVTGFVEEGILQNGGTKENIRYYNSAVEAHGDIKNIVQSGDMVLFQNDWPENYI